MVKKVINNLNTDEYDFNYIIGRTRNNCEILIPKESVANPMFIWKKGNLQTGIRIDKPDYFLSGAEYKSLKDGDIEDLEEFLYEENQYGCTNFDLIRNIINYLGDWNIEVNSISYSLLPKYERYYKKKNPRGGRSILIDKEEL